MFAFPYYFEDAGHLSVYLTNAGGAETLQTISTHYTVSGAGNGGGGSVTFIAAPAATETVTIIRNEPLTQGTDADDVGTFREQAFESQFDRHARQAQRLQEQLDRAVKMKKSSANGGFDFPEPSADAFVGWSTGATALENKTVAALGAVEVVDEDHMSSDSATKVPSQQSVKAYVDTEISGLSAVYQPLDADLTKIAGLASADGNFIVGSATGWVVESGATVRSSLGLGTTDTPEFSDITLGRWTKVFNETYDLFSNVVASSIYLNGTIADIATGKELHGISVRPTLSDVSGTGIFKAVDFDVLVTASDAGANVYGAIGAITIGGAGAAKGLTGRAISASGHTGSLTGIVAGVNALSTSGTCQALQLSNQTGAGASIDYIIGANSNDGNDVDAARGVYFNPEHVFTVGIYTARLNASPGGADFIRLENSAESVVYKVTEGGVSRGAGGSASGPGMSFATDTNTGVFLQAADVLGLTTGGTQRVRVDSNGMQVNTTDGASSNGEDFTVQGFMVAGDRGQTNPAIIMGNVGGGAVVGALTNHDLVLRANNAAVLTAKTDGRLQLNNAGAFEANGSVSVSLTSVGPSGASTTVQEWLEILNNGGTARYIPCF
ncbi:hypothetical protein [Hoeflea poritis]|uniref:hypothetical protein n=1 Tax=Hoeflea poritis TaxID=2993659 RepID=UPI0022F077C8|nr:hypothetical protein [Hoeflea poritis]